MKLPSLKLNKSKAPSLSSLRPPIYKTESRWFLSLGIFFLIFIITGLVGFQLFYVGYFDAYKDKKQVENFSNLINVNKLRAAIGKHNELLNQEIKIPKDPSI